MKLSCKRRVDVSRFINTGFSASFAFDLLNNPTITYSGLTSGFDVVGGTGQGQFDGFGSFEYGVEVTAVMGPNNTNGLPGPLNFTITGSGLSLSSLEQNSSNAFFVADVLAPNGNTGLIDASTRGTNVPEPASLAIFGTALAAIGLLGRRRRNTV